MAKTPWNPTAGTVWGRYDGPIGAHTLDDGVERFTFCGVGNDDDDETFYVFNRVFDGSIFIITKTQFFIEANKWKRIP